MGDRAEQHAAGDQAPTAAVTATTPAPATPVAPVAAEVPAPPATSAAAVAAEVRRRRRHEQAARETWRRLTRAEEPTGPLPIVDLLRRTPYRDPRRMETPEDRDARLSLDVALRIAETLLRGGAGTREVESALIAVTASLGLNDVDVDITNQSVVVHHAPPDRAPITLLRVVRSSTRDYSRLVAVHRLVQDLVDGELTRQSADARLRLIEMSPKPWPRWFVGFNWGVLAAAVVFLVGGGWTQALVAFGSSVAVDRVGRALGRVGVPDFYITFVGSALASSVAVTYVSLAGLPPGAAAPVIAGGIVVLLPGRSLVAAVEDAITGFPVTASGRVFSVVLTTAAMVGGVSLGLALGVRLLGARTLAPDAVGLGVSNLPVLVASAAVAGVAAGIALRCGRELLVPIALVGAVSVAVLSLAGLAGAGLTPATAIASVVAGVLGHWLGMLRGAPSLVVVVPGVSALLPGLAIYRGLAQVADGSPAAFGTLLGATTAALVIGAGAVLGDLLASPLDRSVHERRTRTRRR